MSSGTWNVDSDLEMGRALVNQNVTNQEMNCRPHRVPIGPCNRRYSCPGIENEKQLFVGFMQTLSQTGRTGGLNGVVERLEPRARKWYGDEVAHITPEDLARMLLHDGCYLLGRLVKYTDPTQAVTLSGRFGNTEFRDILFLINNQMPFFVLEAINKHAHGGSLRGYLAEYMKNLLESQGYISKGKQTAVVVQPRHLLDLVYAYFHPTNLLPSTPPQPTRRTGRWRRATEYRLRAGVKFMPRVFADQVTSVLDVHLEGGTLWIPRLEVDSKTWTLLSNLIQLEKDKTKRPVTAYCIFMSQVACTVEDVRLLVDEQIVQHFEGNDEDAARRFADLCDGVVMDVNNNDKNYLKPIWHELEKLCGSRSRNFMALVRQKYCSNWLAIVAFSIVAFLAICQVLQAFYSPIGYHFGKN